MTGGKIAVIGGSIAGCAAALAAHRTGAEVTVLERGTGGLAGRGVGVVLHSIVCRELETAGFIDPETPYLQQVERKWITADGRSRDGCLIGTQPFDFRAFDWGVLWQGLRRKIPSSIGYRTGCRVASVAGTPDDVVVTLADGTKERYDAVIGADGYRSAVRAAMFPGTGPQYAGYLLWRGTVPSAAIKLHSGLWRPYESVVCPFAGGHLIAYLIPGEQDQRVLNWAVYAAPPVGLELDLSDPTSLPPGAIGTELTGHLDVLTGKVPPFWADIIRLTAPEKVLVQPIYDMDASACAQGRLALAGDAAAVARPHTGAGAGKALQDALALASVLRDGETWPAALQAYNEQRAPANKFIVDLGRALGRATVTDSPDWLAMNQAGLDEWWATAGQLRPAAA